MIVDGVDINIDMASPDSKSREPSSASDCDLGTFAHLLLGLLHCYYKDRSFVDPLLPLGVQPSNGQGKLLGTFGEINEQEGPSEVKGEEVGPDDFFPEVAIVDNDSESSDEGEYEEEPDEKNDVAFLAWKRKQGQEEDEGRAGSENAFVDRDGKKQLQCAVGALNDAKQSSSAPKDKEDEINNQDGQVTNDENDLAPGKSYQRKRKAVIVIAHGAQKFEKLSFSLSINRVNVKLSLPREAKTEQHLLGKRYTVCSEKTHHCLELLVESLVVEAIWPKDKSGEMGGHVQAYIKYFHLIESEYVRDKELKSSVFGPKPENVVKIVPILRIGKKRMFNGHDAFPLSLPLNNANLTDNASKCDAFPLMESRQTTWRRREQISGPRAMAFKSTISFVDEVGSNTFLCHISVFLSTHAVATPKS